MANIIIEMLLSDNGSIRRRTRDTQELNAELTRAQTLSRATATPGMSGREYTSARGSAEATGASARDFAAQARGLGGLVRLYATWAANIYAAGAALNALKEAAGVTNMIQGMNQLGAASGIALGSMAKKFADASGGAISLQEAISATIKATSSGLSSKQFEQLGDVASKASRALGVNMSDAVSRLTRGITKLEPELLDELGIFTKVGTASEAYAKKIGKSATSLTDFEKRQAFANAVLKEGLDKFGDINLQANPYDQLSASLKNLAQNTLEIVNKALGPLVRILSSSPNALMAVMAGLGVMLIKQAIPALGHYKESLASTADFAAKHWQKRTAEMRKAQLDSYKYLTDLTEAEAEKRIDAVDRAAKRVEELRAKSQKVPLSSRAQEIIARTSWAGLSDKQISSDLNYLKRTAKLEKQGGNEDLAQGYKEAEKALRKWIGSEKDHAAMLQKVQEQIDKNVKAASAFSHVGYARDQEEKARKRAARTQLVLGAAEDVGSRGIGEAWGRLREGVKTENLGKLQGAFTTVAGGAAIATTAVTRFVSVLSGALGWIGMAVATFTLLYSWVSKNAEESQKLSGSIDTLNESGKILTATFEKYNATFTLQGVEARANAISGLSDALSSTVTDLVKFDKATRGLDWLWEGIKGTVGASQQDKAAESMSKQLYSMISSIDDKALKEELSRKIKKTLGISILSIKEMDKALESIDPSKLEDLKDATDALSVKFKATAAASTAVRESFKETDAAFSGLVNSLKSSDQLSAFADALAKQSKTLTDAFKEPGVAVATLKSVLDDTSKLNAFPPEVQAEVLAQANKFADLTNKVAEYKKELKNLDRSDFVKAYVKEYELKLKIQAADRDIENLGKTFGSVASKQLEYAFAISLKKVDTAAAQANIDAQKSLLAYLPKSVNTIEMSADLERQSLAIRRNEITAIYELVNQLKVSDVEAKLLEERKKLTAPQASAASIAEAQKTIASLNAEQRLLTSKNIAAELPRDRSGKVLLDQEGKIASGAFAGVSGKQAYDQMSLQKGYLSQMATIGIQLKAITDRTKIERGIQTFTDTLNKDKEALKKRDAAFEDLKKSEEYLLGGTQKRFDLEEAYYRDTRAFREAAFTEEAATTVNLLKTIKEQLPGTAQAKEAQRQLEGPEGKLAILAARKSEFARSEDTRAAAAERTRSLALEKTKAEIVSIGYDKQLESLTAINTKELDSLKLQQQLISVAADKAGFISEADAQRQRTLDLEILKVTQQNDLEQERLRNLKAVAAFEAQKKGQDADQVAVINEQISLDNQASQNRVAAINRTYDAQSKVLEATDALGTRMKGVDDVFRNAFSGMADAFVQFARTGKLEFGSLVTEMLAGLLKVELQMQMMQLYTAARPGILNFMESLLGSNPGYTMDTTGVGMGSIGTVDTATLAAGSFRAKGAAYDYGVEMFAKGGTFTNSIVNSPTLFKFAKGTGLMGEAGPEAIMPLTRDSNGSLGVKATGGTQAPNVQVIVNNNSSAQATTTESTDSRGNRRIEVTIAEMVAGEIRRPGSSANRAVMATAGTRAQPIQR